MRMTSEPKSIIIDYHTLCEWRDSLLDIVKRAKKAESDIHNFGIYEKIGDVSEWVYQQYLAKGTMDICILS